MPRETVDFEDGFKSAIIESGKTVEEAEAAYENYMNTTATKDVILGVTEDLVADFLWYSRKEDECLGRGEIERAIEAGVITAEEIAEKFRSELIRNL